MPEVFSAKLNDETAKKLAACLAQAGMNFRQWVEGHLERSEQLAEVQKSEELLQALKSQEADLNCRIEKLKAEKAALENAVTHLKSEKKAMAQGAKSISKEITAAIRQHTEEALTAFRALSERMRVKFEKGVQEQVDLLSDNVKQLQDLDRAVRERSNELAFYLGRAVEVRTAILLREKPHEIGFGEVLLYLRPIEEWVKLPGNDISIPFRTYDFHKLSEVFDCVIKALLKGIEGRQGVEPNIRL